MSIAACSPDPHEGDPTSSTSAGPATGSDGDESSTGASTSTDSGSTDAPMENCGDGQPDPGEACDDGDDDDTDECLPTCEAARCGDGAVQVGVELCDDGNAVDDDDCSNTCTLASCGDGELQPGELCDDGDLDDADECPSSCQPASCGDGFVHLELELCDDGAATPTCDPDCSLAECGDGLVNAAAGEACDDGEATATCDLDCSPAECGDGQLSPLAGEECDDGGTDDGDECSSACKKLQRRVFVSSALYTGDLGGLAGADLECQTLADKAGLTGTYFAWLSDGLTTPAQRFVKSSVPYVLPDGLQVAKNWQDLTDGTLQHAIDVTEAEGPAPIAALGCGGGSKPTVWTNTLAAGTAWAADGCDGWSSNTGAARLGHAKATNFTWAKFCEGQAGSCGWLAALYCVEQ
jgi:cysteine-rich repeat protein